MKQKAIIRFGLLLVIAALVVAGLVKLNRSRQIDKCIDCGGRWNAETGKCDGLYEINAENLTRFYWFTDYDSVSNREFLAKGNLLDSIVQSPEKLIGILNKRAPESKIELIGISNDTIRIRIANDEFLGERMGSTGAICYLGETVFTLTENGAIRFVNVEMNDGSHASPGTYDRQTFDDLIKR